VNNGKVQDIEVVLLIVNDIQAWPPTVTDETLLKLVPVMVMV
jgi:hypothetical protein